MSPTDPKALSVPSPNGTTSRRPGLTRALTDVGIGLAAAGAGVVLGAAAERLRSAISDRPGDWAALGTLRGDQVTVTTSDGVDLVVETDSLDPARAAAGPPLTVVFTHGYSLSMDSWHFQRAALRGRYRLVFWDQRGHGRSAEGEVGAANIDRLGVDLGEVIDAVAPTGPLVLVGHSMGGMTVMALARARPELFGAEHAEGRVVGVGLLATSAGSLARLDLGLPAFGRLVARVHPGTVRLLRGRRGSQLVARGRRLGQDIETYAVRKYSFESDVAPELVRFVAKIIGGTRVSVIADFLPAFGTHDARTSLDVMKGIPALVMTGDDDLMIPPSHSDEIAERLGVPVVRLPETGHLLQLEHPETVDLHLEDLLVRAAAAVPVRKWWRGRRKGGAPRRARRGGSVGADV